MDTLLILVLLTNFRLLATSRLTVCIRWVAAQGLLLGLLPLCSGNMKMIWSITALLSIVTILLKAVVFPWLLFRALHETNARREIEPYVGYNLSLLVGLGMLGLSLWLSSHLPLPVEMVSPLALPVAVFSMLVGSFLICARKKAITQVLGYLVMENGIYTFGAVAAHESPMLVELGMLLDLFVAVFVMGIAICHIARSFDHIDTNRLVKLRD